ncbi:MAG: iron-containing alcohol dehydrogenase [Microbacteriaceae bacterium]|nr:iron-containing alcohol dehydrogenase [Microbacteriaceae bacterium]
MAHAAAASLFASIQDPTDLARLREVIAEAGNSESLVPLGLRQLIVGPDATNRVVDEVIFELTRAELPLQTAKILLLVDDTIIYRRGVDLKTMVQDALAQHFTVTRVVLGHGHLLADDESIDCAAIAVAEADCVVTIGGGTITDIGKVATSRRENLPLIVVQTAASVDGFTDNVSVILRNGVKRTIPSRWPDVVIADTTTISEAPEAMNSAGLGEVLSLYTAPADWQLAAQFGLDTTFHQTPRDLLLAFAGDPAVWAKGLSEGDETAVARLTEVLAIRGIGTGVAGTTACLSGAEHVTSHMLDMLAAAKGDTVGLHGAQVGAASLVAAASWQLLLERLESSDVQLNFPTEQELEERVRSAFIRVDETGRQGAECWSDYRSKLAAWSARRETVESVLSDRSTFAATFGSSVPEPRILATALVAAGSPTGAAGLESWIDDEIWRWAVANCHFMRNRFTVNDLLFFLGWWTDADIDLVLERVRLATSEVLVS